MFCLACDPVRYRYDYEGLRKSVVSVELMEYKATTVKMTQKKSDIDMFDFDKSETVQTLEPSKIDDFLRAFTKVEFFKYEEFASTPIGRCIKLTYSNGDFLVAIGYRKGGVCYSGTHLYDENGNIKEVVGYMSNADAFFKVRDDFFGEDEQ